MARTVEVVGVAGAGKSSLIAALDGVRVGRDRVRDARDALRAPRLPWPAAGPPPPPRLTRDPSPERRTAALLRWAPAWRDFLAHCAEAAPGPRTDPLLRLLRGEWLVRSLELAALAREHGDVGDGTWLLLDEGPLQRVVGRPDPGVFGGLVPAPAAVIRVVTSETTLDRRLRARAEAGRPAVQHREATPDEALAASRADDHRIADAVASVEVRGVPVLVVDGEAAVRDQVDRVAAWLITLVDRTRPPATPGT